MERELNSPAMPMFRSSGEPGYSRALSEDPHRVMARKYELEVQVRFSEEASTVVTAEGSVPARPGDAIITGIGGEHWRVSKERFAQKYRPVPPAQLGEDGAYTSLPSRILAVQMPEGFEVLLADRVSKLTGQPGDWLVDYGDGSLGIVSKAIFPTTYQIIS